LLLTCPIQKRFAGVEFPRLLRLLWDCIYTSRPVASITFEIPPGRSPIITLEIGLKRAGKLTGNLLITGWASMHVSNRSVGIRFVQGEALPDVEGPTVSLIEDGNDVHRSRIHRLPR
jgi:hypothetical protein